MLATFQYFITIMEKLVLNTGGNDFAIIINTAGKSLKCNMTIAIYMEQLVALLLQRVSMKCVAI
jgi:hypothetical protein